MEHNFKRFLSLLLALVMVIGLMPVGHAHAEEVTYQKIMEKVTSVEADATYVIALAGTTKAMTNGDGRTDWGHHTMLLSDFGEFANATNIWTLERAANGFKLKNANGYLAISRNAGSLNETGHVFELAYIEGQGWTIKSLDSNEYCNNLGGYNSCIGGWSGDGTKFDVYTVAEISADEADPFGKLRGYWKKVSVDTETVYSEQEGLFEYAFDNDPSTRWHSNWQGASDKLNGSNTFSGVIDFGKAYYIDQFSFTPRQDTPSGMVTQASLYVKETDEAEWKLVVEHATFASDQSKKNMDFELQPVRFVKFVAEQSNDGWVAVSEFNVACKHIHDYAEEIITPATCTEPGEMTYTCACGYSYTGEIPATGHKNTEIVGAVKPTMNTEGYTGDTYCNDCDKIVENGSTMDKLTAKNAKPLMESWDSGIVSLADCEFDIVNTTSVTYEVSHGGNYYVKPAANGNAKPQRNAYYGGNSLYFQANGKVRISGGGHIHMWNVGSVYTGSDLPRWDKCDTGHGDAENGTDEFYLLKANPDSTFTGVPGYEQITEKSQLVSGESYLIAAVNHAGDWFVMYPSTEAVSIAKVVDDAVTHTHEYTATKQESCDYAGTLTETCECGHVHISQVEPSAHTMAHMEAKDPTCAANGNAEYWYCTVCGAAWLDEECTLVTNLRSVILPATGEHTPGAAATCTEDQICTVCETVLNEKLGHDEITHDAQAPTCTEIGWDAYVTCSRCDYSTYEEKSALGHTFEREGGDPNAERCGECGAVNENYVAPVAQIGEQKFGSLQAAIDAVPANGTEYTVIEMINSHGATDTIVIDNGKKVELVSTWSGSYLWIGVDGAAEGSMTGKPLFDIQAGSELKISGRNRFEFDVHEHDLFAVNGGKLFLHNIGGNIRYNSDKNVVSITAGYADIKAGQFDADDSVVFATGGDVTIDTEGKYGMSMRAYGTMFDWQSEGVLNIQNAGNMYSDVGIIHAKTGTVKIAGGHLQGGYGENAYAVMADAAAQLSITGGKFETLNDAATTIQVDGQTGFVSGGTFDQAVPEQMLTDDVVCFGQDGWYLVQNAVKVHFYYASALDVTVKVPYNTVIPADKIPAAPQQEHYNFIGWYNGDTKVDLTTPVTQNLELEAKYERITYTVTINPNNGSDAYQITVNSGDRISAPEVTFEDHRLEGWYLDAAFTTPYDFTAPVIGGMELYAKWNEIIYAAQVGTTKFEFFDDALAAAKAGEVKVVTLLKEVTITGNTTYDLSGLTIESVGDVFVVTGGTLTLNGDGVIKAGTDNEGAANAIRADGGKVIITGGTYSVGGDSGTHQNDVICTKNGGSVVIYGGKFQNWNPGNHVAEGYCAVLENGYYVVAAHEYKDVVTAPTCEEKGYTTHTCSRCSDSYVDTYVDALGHKYVSEVTTEPTCTEDGVKTFTCSNCNGSYTVPVAALGHDEILHDAQAPTCTEIGWDAYVTCSRCDYSTYEEKTALGHKAGEPVKENVSDATCTTPGTYDEVTYCSVCSTKLSTKKVTGEALGHDYKDVVTAPTCEEKGYTTHTCSRCSDSYVDTYVDALGHKYVGEVTTEPTCTEEGVKTFTCSNCNGSYTEPVAALGHTKGKTVVENNVDPDCVNDGSYDNVVYCTVCHAELSRETVTVDALGHDYKAVVTAPTCTEKGYTTHTCSRCSDSYVDSYVDAKGHSYGEGVVTTEPTCTKEGVKTFTCSNCSDSYTETVAALGHTKGKTVVENNVDPDCVNEGSYDNVVYCTVCHAELSRETVTVDALGHTAGETVVENKVDPDCVNDGSYDNVVYCTVCHAELSRETVTVDALGHTAGETVVENKVDPDCVDDGSYDNVVYCTVCHAELSRQTVTVDALGHTAGKTVVENNVAPTYNTDGSYDNVVYCSVCGEELSRETVTVPAQKVLVTTYEVVLQAEIKLEYTVSLPESLVEAGGYIVLTKDGRWGEVTKEFKGAELAACLKNGAYVVGMGVASGEMNRNVTIQVFDGQGNAIDLFNKNGEARGQAISRSVVAFAQSALNNPESSDERKALVKALLVYGGLAQKFFGVDAENPVYNVLGGAPDLSAVTAETVAGYKNSQSNTNMGVKASQTEAVLDSYICYRVYLNVQGDINDYTFTLTTPKGEQEIACSYSASRGYYVEIPDIASGYIDYEYKLTVTNAAGECNEITTSVLSYVRAVLNNTRNSQEKMDLAKALYLYNQAADAYFTENN